MPLQHMEEDDNVNYTHGGLQGEPLVAARLGTTGGVHCNAKPDKPVQKGPRVETVMDVPLNCCKL